MAVDGPGLSRREFGGLGMAAAAAATVGATLGTAALVSRAARVFRSHSDFPLETVAAPAFVAGINWSDHDSFWREGYRAFMVTDTAPYRYVHYHNPSDTPDKVNCGALARVTMGVEAVVRDLADSREF